MLTLTGQLLEIIHTPAGTNNDGQPYQATQKLQILGRDNTRGRNLVVDVKIDNPQDYSPHVGKQIRVPVSCNAYSAQAGSIPVRYKSMGQKPEVKS